MGIWMWIFLGNNYWISYWCQVYGSSKERRLMIMAFTGKKQNGFMQCEECGFRVFVKGLCNRCKIIQLEAENAELLAADKTHLSARQGLEQRFETLKTELEKEKNLVSQWVDNHAKKHVLYVRVKQQIDKLETELEKTKEQLRVGHHCSSFDMCGDAGEKYELRIAALQAELKQIHEQKACADRMLQKAESDIIVKLKK